MLERIRVFIEHLSGIGRARQKVQADASRDRVAAKVSGKLTDALEANKRATDENARVKELLESLLRDLRKQNIGAV